MSELLFTEYLTLFLVAALFGLSGIFFTNKDTGPALGILGGVVSFLAGWTIMFVAFSHINERVADEQFDAIIAECEAGLPRDQYCQIDIRVIVVEPDAEGE